MINDVALGSTTYKLSIKEKKELKAILKFFEYLHCEKCHLTGIKVIYALSESWKNCPIYIKCSHCDHKKLIGYMMGELK